MISRAFVGRAAEISTLERAYQDESVHTVLISGEAGLGKSRLVHEFTRRLGSHPLVLTGRCLEFGNDGLAYAPFLPLMRTLPQVSASRAELFSELLSTLERSAADRPVMLVLEDLHWADGASRELLSFLVANVMDPGVFMIATHRPPAGQFLLELGRSASVVRLTPAPLTRHEVGRQLAGLRQREPDPVTVTKVFERSQGNPLFVEALSQSPDDTPAELRELLLARLPELAAAAKHLLEVAAAAGVLAEHQVLQTVGGLPENELHQALRQLVGEHLLVVSGPGYAFRHALIRDAVYDSLLPAQRRSLHAALAEAASDPGQRSAHASAAGDHALALETSWQAAATVTFAEAARLHFLQRVLELWSEVDDAAAIVGVDRLTVLDHAIKASVETSSAPVGLRLCAEALALEPSVQRYLHQARLKNLTNASGDEDLRQALLLSPPDPLRGEVLAELASLKVFRGDTAGALADATAAHEIAERLGLSSLLAHAHTFLGLASSSDPVVAKEHFARARAVADPHALVTVATWESALLTAIGEYDTAIDVIQQGLGAAHQTYEFSRHGPILLVKWVQSLIGLGRFEEALELIDETQGGQDLPSLSNAALLISRADALLALGSADAAQSAVDSAQALLGPEPWVRSYRLRLRTAQARLTPERAAALYAAAIEDGLAEHPHEAWALVAAVKPHPLPDLPVIGPVDAAYRAEALGQTRPSAGTRARSGAMGLTARELDVLRLVAEGKSNRQIAQELFISGNTAGVHVSRILTKLGASTRTEAARKFLDAQR
ncbi:ATP-binding protein [Catelliglobosispora koreensis]|uniref:ATP-binding protein n=1 Tax=Catelliglobosispora koreensis TaxID=129052 RepID=UPI001B7FA02C|nr:LuxR family transcriptional regulator [Catelliglobosispora koreensis]